MKVLVVSPSHPQPDGKGHAIRAAAISAALAQRHHVEVFVPAASRLQRVAAGLLDLLSGRPAQLGYSMRRHEWRRVLERAAAVDVVLAITVRMVRGPLPALLVVDHVDALSRNWRRRASGPEPLIVRLMARLEAMRLRKWEGRVAGWSCGQIAVSREEAEALPTSAPAHVLEHVALLEPLPLDGERDIDVVFTGFMRYPPNRQAAEWLDREIVPILRRLRADTRVVIAGRDANRLRLRNVEVMSDVASIPAVLARSRVALVPLTGLGTGVPTKVLEAVLCGAALVVTPWVRDQVALPCRVAGDAAGLAAETVDLLQDELARDELADRARAAIPADGLAATAARLESILASVKSEPRRRCR